MIKNVDDLQAEVQRRRKPITALRQKADELADDLMRWYTVEMYRLRQKRKARMTGTGG